MLRSIADPNVRNVLLESLALKMQIKNAKKVIRPLKAQRASLDGWIKATAFKLLESSKYPTIICSKHGKGRDWVNKRQSVGGVLGNFLSSGNQKKGLAWGPRTKNTNRQYPVSNGLFHQGDIRECKLSIGNLMHTSRLLLTLR